MRQMRDLHRILHTHRIPHIPPIEAVRASEAVFLRADQYSTAQAAVHLAFAPAVVQALVARRLAIGIRKVRLLTSQAARPDMNTSKRNA
jgi:hypothetical protein